MRPHLASFILWFAARILPHRRREWLAAMRAEADSAPDEDALQWATGCLLAALAERMKDRRTLHAMLLPLLGAALLYVDWHTKEAALSVTLLIATAAILAYVRPERMVASGIFVGMILIAAHAFANFTWLLVPFYQFKPLELWEWLIIVSVLPTAMVGACIGGFAHRALNSR